MEIATLRITTRGEGALAESEVMAAERGSVSEIS
jgi:hypothetical protein